MNLNCYSQFNTGWECGFENVRLHMTDMKGLSSHTVSCHWQLRTFTACKKQCFQHIPTHATRCLPTHQHTLQTRWDLITCILIDGYQFFRATICFHFSFALKMVATNSSQNSQSFTKVHGTISQKTKILIHTMVRISDLIWEHINL
jgi:hypothetical protein